MSAPNDGAVLSTLPAGSQVLVYAVADNWANINTAGLEGYLPLSCLTLEASDAAPETPTPTEAPTAPPTQAPVEEPTPTPLPEASVQETDEWQAYTARTTAKGVNVRKKPSQSAGRVTQLNKKGEQVTVLSMETNDKGETWYLIETTKGKKGYIRSDLLERIE